MKFYTAQSLLTLNGIKHGFFSRNDGVSNGIYQSLNVGLASHDNPQNVTQNRNSICKTLGFNPKNLMTPFQIHSNKCIIINEIKSPLEADAYVTQQKNILLGVVTADCLPILIAEPNSNIIAAIHAGWKGTLSGIIENTIKTINSMGGKTQNIIAAIGPAIQQKSYLVQQDFYNSITQQEPNAEQFFSPNNQNNPISYQFNLPEFAKLKMTNAGILNIEIITQDTCSNQKEFFSYRRSQINHENDYGRQISTIGIL